MICTAAQFAYLMRRSRCMPILCHSAGHGSDHHFVASMMA